MCEMEEQFEGLYTCDYAYVYWQGKEERVYVAVAAAAAAAVVVDSPESPSPNPDPLHQPPESAPHFQSLRIQRHFQTFWFHSRGRFLRDAVVVVPQHHVLQYYCHRRHLHHRRYQGLLHQRNPPISTLSGSPISSRPTPGDRSTRCLQGR